MQAYLNDPVLKARLLEQIQIHEQQNQIVKGTYGEMNGQWHGCAIGCALHSLNLIEGKADPTEATGRHDRFPAELGIPLELAYLIDTIFENLPDADSQTWPQRVTTAIPVGADLSGVMPALLQWSILHPTYGWIVYAKTPAQQEVVRRFAALVARDWSGTAATEAEWSEMDEALDTIPEWAWARAWAGAGAGAWARAGARAGAGAWARAGAGADWYLALSLETLRRLELSQ